MSLSTPKTSTLSGKGEFQEGGRTGRKAQALESTLGMKPVFATDMWQRKRQRTTR